MKVALIDNGSLEPAAHLNLRRVAGALSRRSGVAVSAVSWKHSDRIEPVHLEGVRAETVGSFVRAAVAAGERDLVFVPFFISPQGAIGSALANDLAQLQREVGGFEFRFSDGLAQSGVLPAIVAERIRAAATTASPSPQARGEGRGARGSINLSPVVLVDHGGPSGASAALRNQIAADTFLLVGREVASLTAASMEGAHPPLLADILAGPGCAGQDVIVAPLFLSPGRHAGLHGDIAEICRQSPARCVVADLIGTHPLAVDALAAGLQRILAAGLQRTLSPLHA
jgi:sirohydrochlorin ferrochelatase